MEEAEVQVEESTMAAEMTVAGREAAIRPVKQEVAKWGLVPHRMAGTRMTRPLAKRPTRRVTH
jgi:hypothetical protein